LHDVESYSESKLDLLAVMSGSWVNLLHWRFTSFLNAWAITAVQRNVDESSEVTEVGRL